MEQNKQKNVKRYIETAEKDYKAWLKNSGENKRGILCATLLHIQELAELMQNFDVNTQEIKNIENAVNNIHNSITAHV